MGLNQMNVFHGMLAVPGAKLYYKVRGEGPALLILQGGAGDADAPDSLASNLATDFTVITCDRRGLARSPLDDPKQPVTLTQHADDALALLHEITPHPGFVFGSSLGALIGLELLVHYPACIRQLVVHDALAYELLSPEEQQDFLALRKRVGEIALSEGMQSAMRHFLAAIGVDKGDREDDVDPPVSTRERTKSGTFFLSRESRAADIYRLDVDALRAWAHLIIPVYSTSSKQCFPARSAIALARVLGKEALPFPGGHTGYLLHPRGFADALRNALLSNHRQSYVAGPLENSSRLGVKSS